MPEPKPSFQPKKPPSWWPENEPWPPSGFRDPQHRKRFTRGLGCSFIFFLLGVSGILTLVFGKIAERFGWVTFSLNNRYFVPLTIFISCLILFMIVRAGKRFARTTRYVNEVLKAADKLAEGDYSVRVLTDGPPALHNLGRAFNKMAGRLEENDQIKRNMLADVTHELRTPLTVIQGNLEAIQDGVYEADAERLSSLYEETEVMAHLIEDLRTLALAESGALILNKELTDLVDLTEDVVSVFQEAVREKKIRLTFETSPDLPLMNVSAVRMREVLSNLLNNAIRHTPQLGQIELRIDKTNQDQGDWIQITITDTGEGIPEQDLDRIFERFYKSGDSGGMGLGLSIAKRLVEAHDGQLTAESTLGEGTKMRIILPVVEEI